MFWKKKNRNIYFEKNFSEQVFSMFSVYLPLQRFTWYDSIVA